MSDNRNELASRGNFGGYFTVEHWRDGEKIAEFQSDNIVVNEGLEHMLDEVLSDDTVNHVADWYIGIFEANYTPLATDTGANIATNSTESTAYDEATRQAWTEAGVTSKSITNNASKATFTINASKTIYGAFLAEASAKSGNTGVLMAASNFGVGNERAVVDNDELLITYTLTASST